MTIGTLEIAEHVGASCIFVHEEGQQAPELLSVSAVAMTRVPCLVIYVGDGNQSPGGIKDSKLAQRLRSELMRLPIGLRAGQKSRTPANLSVALTKTTAMWQGLDVADALSHTGAVSSGSVFAPWSRVSLSTQDGGPLGPSSQSVPSPADTLGDTDFVAWVLRVAPECRNLHLHTPVGTTLAIAFIMLSPERPISFQQAHSVMECCGLMEGPDEWCLTLSTTSRVPKPVYEALLGTLYSDLVFKEGSEWKFGTGTRNVNRNEPHGFRFLYWRDATRRNRDPRRRGKASARAIVAAVHAAYEIFDHIPCFPADKPGTTPGQIIMTNTKFQRDSLLQSLPKVKFPQPVRNPWYAPPANQGTDDSQTHAPPAKRPKRGKGKGGKQHDRPQVPELTEVPTRLETVVKLSGSTCYRAMVIQDACGFLSGRRHRHDSQRQQSEAQLRTAAVKRREAFTRANVGLSRAIGTTIIVSPLDMAGQPGACIVTAVLQAGFAIVDTTAHGEAEIQTALDTEIRSDQDMEACLNGRTFGQFPLPMALCWQRVEESSNQSQLHRLHLVLTDASKYNPRHRDHPAYPGGSAIGLLWGYALDGEEKPVWEVRPNKDGWQLQHVHGGGHHPLTSQSGCRAHRFWPLHRVHAYDAFSLRPVLNDPRHFDAAHHQRPDALLPSSTSLLHRHRDVRDENPAVRNAPPPAGRADLRDETDIITISDSDISPADTGVHWDFGTSSSARRIQFTSHFKGIKEEDGAQEVAIGFPSSDNAEESTVARYNATVAELAHLCHCLKTQSFPPPRFHFSQLAQLPFEWPMARLSIDFPSVASSFAQNVSRLAVERTLRGQRLTETWLETTCELFAWEATGQAASVIAPLFQGTGSVEALHRFPGWLHLESLEFWQKALYIELAGECYDLAPMSRNSQSPTVHKRHADSISSFVVIQRQKQNANRLPIQNVKVYFPCILTTKVLENLPRLALEDAVTVNQSVGDAIQQEAVSVGTTCHDATQNFSTLVLRAGRTILPRLQVQSCDTPLTQQVFAAVPLRPRTWRRPLGKPRSVWKSVLPALNNLAATSTRKRSGTNICPRHGMSCSLIQRKRLPSRASPVVSKLHRASFGTRMAAPL